MKIPLRATDNFRLFGVLHSNPNPSRANDPVCPESLKANTPYFNAHPVLERAAAHFSPYVTVWKRKMVAPSGEKNHMAPGEVRRTKKNEGPLEFRESSFNDNLARPGRRLTILYAHFTFRRLRIILESRGVKRSFYRGIRLDRLQIN